MNHDFCYLVFLYILFYYFHYIFIIFFITVFAGVPSNVWRLSSSSIPLNWRHSSHWIKQSWSETTAGHCRRPESSLGQSWRHWLLCNRPRWLQFLSFYNRFMFSATRLTWGRTPWFDAAGSCETFEIDEPWSIILFDIFPYGYLIFLFFFFDIFP